MAKVITIEIYGIVCYLVTVFIIAFSITAIAPSFFLIALGIFLRKVRLLDSALTDRLSRMVFFVFLPALLFNTISRAEFSSLLTDRIFMAAWGTLIAGAVLARIIAFVIKSDAPGLFVSGSVWSNVAIIGFSLTDSIYGAEGMARTAILTSLLLPMHTIFGVCFMSMDRNSRLSIAEIKKAYRQLAGNPIIIATFMGIITSFLPFGLPSLITDVLSTLGRASLPLALISIGASLHFSSAIINWTEISLATVIKLFLLPLIGFFLAQLFALGPEWTGSIILAFASPSAVSFFVVSRNFGYNAARGAAIVTFATLGASVSTGMIIALMRWGGLILNN